MRNLLFAGTTTILSFVLRAAAAFSATSADAGKPDAGKLVEGRAAYEPAGELGQIGNDFGPGFNLGAPSSAKDLGAAEVAADQTVTK
jgi:hypothetical protein